jgi:hypothetical protein
MPPLTIQRDNERATVPRNYDWYDIGGIAGMKNRLFGN